MGLTDKDKENSEIEYHPAAGVGRGITFIQPDGTRLSIPYGYLPIIGFDPGGDQNTITMAFPLQTVKLTGYRLAKLIEALEAHMVKSIKCSEERYFIKSDGNKIVIVKIDIA